MQSIKSKKFAEQISTIKTGRNNIAFYMIGVIVFSLCMVYAFYYTRIWRN